MPYPDLFKELLFLEIETVACAPDFESLNERMQWHWKQKMARRIREGDSPESLFKEKASLYAEFSQVYAIGVGVFFKTDEENAGLRVKVFSGDDEKALLRNFREMLRESLKKKRRTVRFVSHNGKEFDYPFLARRMLANELTPPDELASLRGVKPWDNPHFDTMEMWRYGDSRHFVSLHALASLFDLRSRIPNPESADIHRLYYEEKDFDLIRKHCFEDVILTAQVFLKLNLRARVAEEDILRVEEG